MSDAGSGARGRRRPGGWSSRRRLAAAGAAAVLVGAAIVVASLLGGGAVPTTSAGAGTRTTTVLVTGLRQTTPVDGTIGFAGPYTVVEPSGNPSATLAHDRQAVSSAQTVVAGDRSSLDVTTAGDQQAETEADQNLQADEAESSSDQSTLQDDQATLSADQQQEADDCQGAGSAGSGSDGGGSGNAGSGNAGSGSGSSPCSADEARVASDQQKADQDHQVADQDRAKVSADRDQVASARQKTAQDRQQGQSKLANDEQGLAAAQQALGTDATAATTYGPTSKFTALPAVGQVVSPGQAVWSVDGQPTLLLPGALTPWRAFTSGMSSGPDVAVLNGSLAALGYGAGPAGSDIFTASTAAAIDRLQADHGLPRTGELDLGSVLFSPGPIRVTAVHPVLGAGVGAGQPVLDVTSTTPVVNVALAVDQTYLVKGGDAVTVTLPDNSTAAGTVTAVGTVATAPPGNSGGGGGNNSSSSATVDVTVALDHPSASASLDQAPVTVDITNSSEDHVLAVPTTALLALAGGGYALEAVDPGGAHHLEAVRVGIFDDQSGLVQVSGTQVSAGQQVVIPAS
jgi:hypothetical protein